MFDGDVTRVVVSEPKVADAIVVSPHEVMINGRAPGTTMLIVWESGSAPQRGGRFRVKNDTADEISGDPIFGSWSGFERRRDCERRGRCCPHRFRENRWMSPSDSLPWWYAIDVCLPWQTPVLGDLSADPAGSEVCEHRLCDLFGDRLQYLLGDVNKGIGLGLCSSSRCLDLLSCSCRGQLGVTSV